MGDISCKIGSLNVMTRTLLEKTTILYDQQKQTVQQVNRQQQVYPQLLIASCILRQVLKIKYHTFTAVFKEQILFEFVT